jgi:hypothetical protein
MLAREDRLSRDVRYAEILFASPLQLDQTSDPQAVCRCLGQAVRRFGVQGCAAVMAQAFGDNPMGAAVRMRWCRELASSLPKAPCSR